MKGESKKGVRISLKLQTGEIIHPAETSRDLWILCRVTENYLNSVFAIYRLNDPTAIDRPLRVYSGTRESPEIAHTLRAISWNHEQPNCKSGNCLKNNANEFTI